jgi:hypothetical protein
MPRHSPRKRHCTGRTGIHGNVQHHSWCRCIARWLIAEPERQSRLPSLLNQTYAFQFPSFVLRANCAVARSTVEVTCALRMVCCRRRRAADCLRCLAAWPSSAHAKTIAISAVLMAINEPLSLTSDFYPTLPSGDLLLCAKHLFVAAGTMSCSHHAVSATGLDPIGLPIASNRSLTGHLNRGIDGVFKIVRVVGGGLVSIAEVHAIRARAHLTQSESKMARDRFGLLERHGFVKSSLGSSRSRTNQLSIAVEAACQLVALDLRERHHTCLASRISMASTHGSLRQRLALRSASARLAAHSAWLQAGMPLGQRLLGGCAARWITRQCE